MFHLTHRGTAHKDSCSGAEKEELAHALETLLRARRSVRRFAHEPLTLDQISQLVWAAQGFVNDTGSRTAPSAGALYPLYVHVVAGDVDGIEAGVYKYQPRTHTLARESTLDLRDALCAAAFAQESVRAAPVDLVLVASFDLTTGRYHERGLRYVYMEAGHAAQNIYLLATALGLGTVAIGAFDDDQVRRCLSLSPNDHPLYILPVGYCRAP